MFFFPCPTLTKYGQASLSLDGDLSCALLRFAALIRFLVVPEGFLGDRGDAECAVNLDSNKRLTFNEVVSLSGDSSKPVFFFSIFSSTYFYSFLNICTVSAKMCKLHPT